MGKLSSTNPKRYRCRLWTAALLCISVFPLHAQTTISATAAPLLLPTAVTYDAQGNLYIAETGNHRIRKVDTTGSITTVAGTGTQGYSGDSGPATSAQLDSPRGLAISATCLYLADTNNHRIRRITLATGIITTIAGTGSAGYSGDGALATTAALDLPAALAVDTTGDLYLADSANHRIRRIDASTGIITTVAGTGTQGFYGDGGPATQAAIDSPSGIALDATGNLYLADTHNHRIRRIDGATGIITTIAGTGTPGFSGDSIAATSSTLALPRGLTLDAAGNLLIADTANHRIRRIDAVTGIITTIAGQGTEAYLGDNGPATQATLDSPRAVVAQSNLITLADTGNQRVRQIASDATISTAAGIGVTIPGSLSLSAPSVIGYGTGQITATLSSATATTGSITFFDTYLSNTTQLGTAALSANAATLSSASLPAGAHNILATYSGDASHASAQSTALPLTISPRQLTATIAPIALLYGQPTPPLSGSLAGVLPQDTSNVSITFSTTATKLSPPGAYPIATTLSGSAAGNYSVAPITATVSIAKAPANIAINSSSSQSAITLTAQVATTTTGNPTGTVTFLDGATILSTTPLSIGSASYTTGALSTGTHTITALYSGDADFLAATSTPATISIGTTTPADFTLAATGTTTQAVPAGTAANYTFTTQTQGTTLASAITLAASGLPVGAIASFNPAYIPPGSAANTFTLTITTPASALSKPARQSSALRGLPATLAWLLIPCVGALRRSTIRSILAIVILSTIATLTLGCGDRINTAAQANASTATYTIVVTGTATSPAGSILQHTAQVILQVE